MMRKLWTTFTTMCAIGCLLQGSTIGPGDKLGFFFVSGAALLGIVPAVLIRYLERHRPSLALDLHIRRVPSAHEPVRLPKAA